MIHAMIDLETLSTQVDAACLSIGVQKFDENGLIGGGWYALFDIDEQIENRRVDASTVLWWMKQSDEARAALFEEQPRSSMLAVFEELGVQLGAIDRVWSQGSNFDLAILEHMGRSHGFRIPWKYNAVRDTRTLYDWLPDDRWPEREGTHHNALDDAKHQARCIVAAMQYLRQPTKFLVADFPVDQKVIVDTHSAAE